MTMLFRWTTIRLWPILSSPCYCHHCHHSLTLPPIAVVVSLTMAPLSFLTVSDIPFPNSSTKIPTNTGFRPRVMKSLRTMAVSRPQKSILKLPRIEGFFLEDKWEVTLLVFPFLFNVFNYFQ